MSRINIVNVGYRSTNYWVISVGRWRLLVDLGWPGRMGQLQANLKQMDIPLSEIHYGLATHYHIDHAGLAQNLKNAGVALLVIDLQQPAIPQMKRWTKPQDNYTDIKLTDNVVISCAESRAFLAKIDLPGQILPTPGHSADSVSLLLDDGSAFTGDLTHPNFIGPEDPTVVHQSWALLRQHGAKRIYPGHGPVRAI
jgi:glyoxylase-like metal-dependent hydrolase (beta-lactamase superfamily II)